MTGDRGRGSERAVGRSVGRSKVDSGIPHMPSTAAAARPIVGWGRANPRPLQSGGTGDGCIWSDFLHVEKHTPQIFNFQYPISKERSTSNKIKIQPDQHMTCPTLQVYADRPTRFGSGQIADGESEREGWMDG